MRHVLPRNPGYVGARSSISRTVDLDLVGAAAAGLRGWEGTSAFLFVFLPFTIFSKTAPTAPTPARAMPASTGPMPDVCAAVFPRFACPAASAGRVASSSGDRGGDRGAGEAAASAGSAGGGRASAGELATKAGSPRYGS